MRSPICAFLGHVDAGKTSIMDAIRNTFFAYRESGGLTQNIGITEVPTYRIKEITSDLLKRFKVDVSVPSIIFIDSPGHEAFVTLRERGASIADLAILTVDVTEGLQKQTIESIDILRSYKTPFLVALTKIDTVQGYIAAKHISVMELLEKGSSVYSEHVDKEVYSLVTELANYGFQAERYDRITDFTKQLAIIPISAINNIGIKDLIVMIIGLSQKYVMTSKSEGDQAAILEEKLVKGVGKVYDSIIYSGELNTGDRVLMQTHDGPAETKIKAIMRLTPLEESRENFGKYENVKSASATTPIRLVLHDPEALIGTSIAVFKTDEDKARLISELAASTKGYNDDSAKGIVVCADSIGSIDAIKKIGSSKGIEIGKTKIGEPTKNDIATARLNNGVILAFNVPIQKHVEIMAKADGITIISTNSIYTLFDRYSEFISSVNAMRLKSITSNLILPAKIMFIKNNIFRRSGPCIFGVEVIGGEIRPGYPLINKNGEKIGRIINIQDDKKALEMAVKGDKVAISVDNAVYGRDIKDEDILYTDMEIHDIVKFEDIKNILPQDYSEVLAETQKIKKF